MIATEDQATVEVFDSMENYFSAFAGDMADRVEDAFEPGFDPETETLSMDVAALLSDPVFRPYPAQAVGVEALVRAFGTNDVNWLAGEMGVGKTLIALWVLRILAERDPSRKHRWCITAPNQLMKKWKRHAEAIIPGVRAIIIKSWRDLTELADEHHLITKGDGPNQIKRQVQPTQNELWIIPRDRGKLGYAWSIAVNQRERCEWVKSTMGERVRMAPVTQYLCPKCGTVIKDKYGHVADKDHFLTKRNKPKKRLTCSKILKGHKVLGDGKFADVVCDEPLWQAWGGESSPVSSELPTPKIAPRRMAPCAYLRSMGVDFDMYIADEVHELKGRGSLQGQMYADLVLASKYVLNLTGTLSGGYADNLLHLLWRTIAWKMREDGLTYDDAGFERFVQRYGVIQTIKRYGAVNSTQSVTDLLQGRGKQRSRTTKCMPGIAPTFFVNYMLAHTVFIRLMEMHAHLPKFDERVHAIPLDPAQDGAMAIMQEAWRQHRAKYRNTKAWSASRSVFLRWLDKPWIDPYSVMDENEDGMPMVAFNVPSLPLKEYPKERRIRRIVKRNMLRGRKTWVFTELTGRNICPSWDWMDYLADYLTEHGVRVAVLRAEGDGGPNPQDREEWIEKTAPDVDVIISNPRLVQTGLDLFHFPSLCFAFTGDSTYVLRQASRRSWRLGQEHDCEVDYCCYTGVASNSAQEAALTLMAQKMTSALGLEGDLSASSFMTETDDIATQMARFIDGKLELESVGDAFYRYRVTLEAAIPTVLTGAQDIQPPEPTVVVDRTPKEPFVAGTLGKPPTKAAAKPPTTAPPPPTTAPPPKADRPIRSHGSVSARKTERLDALEKILGQPAETTRDWHRFGGRWVQVVAKKRQTVRARNFSDFHTAHPDGWIAFVEPVGEVGVTTSKTFETHNGTKYCVSMMAVASYMGGDRVPSDPIERTTA